MTPTLTTDRLILRPPKPEDWDAEAPFWTSDRSAALGGPYSTRDAWRRFCARFGHNIIRGFGMFTVTLKGDDTAIAMVGPLHPEGGGEPELGWTIFRGDLEGTGIVYEAAMASRDYCFDVLGWDTVVSYILPDNARSIALAERMGAVLDDAAHNPFDVPCLVYRHPKPEVVQ